MTEQPELDEVAAGDDKEPNLITRSLISQLSQVDVPVDVLQRLLEVDKGVFIGDFAPRQRQPGIAVSPVGLLRVADRLTHELATDLVAERLEKDRLSNRRRRQMHHRDAAGVDQFRRGSITDDCQTRAMAQQGVGQHIENHVGDGQHLVHRAAIAQIEIRHLTALIVGQVPVEEIGAESVQKLRQLRIEERREAFLEAQ